VRRASAADASASGQVVFENSLPEQNGCDQPRGLIVLDMLVVAAGETPEVLHPVDGSLDAIAQAVNRLIERPIAVLMRATSDSSAHTALAQIASNVRIAVALVAKDAAVVVSDRSVVPLRGGALPTCWVRKYPRTVILIPVIARLLCVVLTHRSHTICILYIAVFSDENPTLVQEQQMANRGRVEYTEDEGMK